VRFIHQDFTDPLPLREGSFDLLPALYAPGVARAMARYLCVGGLLATDNHGGDAVDTMREENRVRVDSGGTGRKAADLVFEAPDIPPVETGSPPNRSGAPGYDAFERVRDHAGR